MERMSPWQALMPGAAEFHFLDKRRTTVKKNSFYVSVAALFAAQISAGGWTLGSDHAQWHVDEQTGAIQSADAAGGIAAVSRCRDVYEVVYTNRVAAGSESEDRVLSAETNGLPSRLTLECGHSSLGLSIHKWYRIDEHTGWLMKKTAIVAPELEKSFVHFLSNVRVPTSMWNGAYLYHPIWNSGGSPMVRTEEITGERHFRAADGTGLMTLSHPGHDVNIGHARYANHGEPVFFDHVQGIRGSSYQNLPEIEERQSDTVARPGQWTMSALHGPVGNGVTDPVTVEMIFAVTPGDFYDFQLAYKAVPAIRDILHYESLTTPAWVKDHLIDVWTDYTVAPETTGRAFSRLFKRMPFGFVSVVVFGYYENSYSYPGDDEQWADHLSTVEDQGHYFESMEKRGKKVEDYLVRREDGLLVTRCVWKPSEQRAMIKALMAAAGESQQLKPAVYTHMGTSGQDREAPIVRNHPEIILTRANGEPYRHATDYNMNWNRPVGLRLQGASPVLQDWWVDILERQLDFVDLDMTYFDTLARASVNVDWKHHRAVQSQEMYALYKRFIEVTHEHDAALFTNYAVPMFNDLSYTEQAGYPTYKSDWHAYAARISGQQVLNRRGRPLIVVNTPHSFELPFPPESLHDDSVPFILHSPLLHNVRMSLHPASQNDPDRQVRFAHKALPWLQAFYELRMRDYANPHVRPRWWAHETELETHGYTLSKDAGIVSCLNHAGAASNQKVAFETAPLGLQPGKPAWVWRLQLPHPRQADDTPPAADAPIPRLARQTLVAYHTELPDRLEYEEPWPSETPVHLLITHSPALIRAVGDTTCQFFLPEAYRATVSGTMDIKTGRLDLLAENRHEDAELLIPSTPDSTPGMAQMLRVGTMHEAGVLPAAEPIEVETTRIDGQAYILLKAPKGSTEFILR
jgi:hypothetical protein